MNEAFNEPMYRVVWDKDTIKVFELPQNMDISITDSQKRKWVEKGYLNTEKMDILDYTKLSILYNHVHQDEWSTFELLEYFKLPIKNLRQKEFVFTLRDICMSALKAMLMSRNDIETGVEK